MFPFFSRLIGKQSTKHRLLRSPHLTNDGRKVAERLVVGESISVERLLNEIGRLTAALETITDASDSRRSIGL